jgi:solute carrier family 6 amino acid transporter-like protein 5/7/9/14
MLFTLGVGSASSLTGCVITVINDDFPQWKKWKITAVVSAIGFACGLVYVTPGGQYILDLVDYFGGGFIIFIMAILETFAISWIYGKYSSLLYALKNSLMSGMDSTLHKISHIRIAFSFRIRIGKR